MAITKQTQLKRLNILLGVMREHAANPHKTIELAPGVHRRLNMKVWDCGTAACALGSYVLTPYGRRYFNLDPSGPEILHDPLLRAGTTGDPIYDAAIHFGINESEAADLFLPSQYPSRRPRAALVIARIEALIKKCGGVIPA